MTIKTIEQYRASISKRPTRSSGNHGTDMKYFVAGFRGAASAARGQQTKASKSLQTAK